MEQRRSTGALEARKVARFINWKEGLPLGAGCVAAALSIAPPCRACEPAQPTGHVDELPSAWRDAMAELVAETADPLQPWGCPDATVRVDMEGDAAWLRVQRRGAAVMERELTAPAELVPLAKAMLARVQTPEPVPAIEAAPAQSTTASKPDATAAAEGEAEEPPLALVSVSGGVRYVGTTPLVSSGVGARATLLLGSWGVSLWGRYDVMVDDLATPIPDLQYSEVAMGAGLSFAPIVDPVRFAIGLNGGLAVVSMEAETRRQLPSEPDSDEEVKGNAVDGRLGLDLSLRVPLVSFLGLRFATDAEISPRSLAKPERRLDPQLPRMSAYSLGAALGLEAAIP